MTSRSQIRRLVIQGLYNTNLIQQLYEQAAPTPTDPAAAPPPPADPAAAPSADPAATAATPPPAIPGAPPADPAAAALTPPPVPGDPAAAGATPPPAPPAVPGAAPPATPPVPGTPPAGAPAAGETAKKKAKAPDPAREPVKSQVNKALMKATAAATGEEEKVATESLRRRSMRFLLEQESEEAKIDVGVYAGEIAKLIKNYTSLVDVKKNVITQAEEYLDDEFPKQAETLKKQLKDLLRKDYHISLERPEPPSDSYAVGAKSGGAGTA